MNQSKVVRYLIITALFSFLVTISGFAKATTYTTSVGSETALNQAINTYKTGSYKTGVITITDNIQLNSGIITLQNVNNLTLRGNTPSRSLTIGSTVGTPSYQGTLSILDSNNIKIQDLVIKAPSNNATYNGQPTTNKRAVSIGRSDRISLHNLTLQPSGVVEGAIAIVASSTNNLAITKTDISGFYGGGMVLRVVYGFSISNCSITDMNNGKLSSIPSNLRASNVGIQVDSITGWDAKACTTATTSPSDYSGDGLIADNYLENLPGQGIFLDSAQNVVIDNNDLTSIGVGAGCGSGVDCGGRAIYTSRGENFWIRNNTINGVDNGRSGGGINAGGKNCANVIIEGNQISWTGNTDQVSAGSLNPSQSDWNGWGISVRERAVVRYNTVHYASTYGILIQPDATDIYIDQNEVRFSYLNNIKAVPGFTYAGQYINAPDHCVGEHWSHEVPGPLTRVMIIDNFLADAEGYSINIAPRTAAEMQHNSSQWDPAWSSFDVKMRNNSLHRNDSQGQGVGIYVGQPSTGYGYWHASYLHSGYNGQAIYSQTEPGSFLNYVLSVNWFDHIYLDLSHIDYPVVNSNGDFTHYISY